jgi:hypothetical protein
MAMYDIPQPEVLDPDRIGGNRDSMSFAEHRDLASRLDGELRQTCAYARALWEELDAVRHYLVESLPRPAGSGSALGGAAPTGPLDDQGWQAWMGVYSTVVSTLEGPRGDAGFGMDEARQIMRSRLDFPSDQQPTLETIERTAPA